MRIFRSSNLGLLAIALVLTVSVAGCTQQEKQGTAIGAVVGAGLGAIIGHQSGRAIEGAVIGAAIGGAIGYVVGRSRSEKVADSQSTAQSQNYRAVQGLALNITDADVSPDPANRGSEVDLKTTFAMNNPDQNENILIRQRFALYKDGQLVGDIVEDNFTMKPGTHRLTRTIMLKSGMSTGTYTFATHIRGESSSDVADASKEVTFTVR